MVNDHSPIFDQYLSFRDLQKLDDWKLALSDKSVFERLIYENGADLSKGYKVIQAEHRPRTSPFGICNDFMVRFKERTDKEFEKYRQVEDIIRDTESSIARHGMKMSMGADSSLSEIMTDEDEE